MSTIIFEEAGKDGIPLIDVEGTAYECGYAYAQIVRERYPGYRRYLDQIYEWERPDGLVRELFEKHAPFVLEIYRGMIEGDRKGDLTGERGTCCFDESGCTSFAVSGSLTESGEPLCGQNKDTLLESEYLYIILRMKIEGGPVILVLCYPGDLLEGERGCLTAEMIFGMLADHSRYPLGLCRHPNEHIPDYATTASLIANPAAGKLWVVRGQPCRGSAQCYRIKG